MVIYIDVLLITNFLIAYFLMEASAILSGYTYSRKTVSFASALAAVCCLYIFAQIEDNLIDLIFKFASMIICSVAAFGIRDKKRLFIQSGCYLLLNMLLTGIVSLISLKNTAVYENNMFFYFNINPVILVSSSAVIYLSVLTFELFKEKISPQNLYIFDIHFNDFSIMGLKAFYDSGFKLKDIISNKDVIVVGYEKVKDSLPQGLNNSIWCFLNNRYSEVNDTFVPVFFNTLAGNGMMPAVKCKYISADNKIIKNILVAFTLNELSENVSAIFGTGIKRQL